MTTMTTTMMRKKRAKRPTSSTRTTRKRKWKKKTRSSLLKLHWHLLVGRSDRFPLHLLSRNHHQIYTMPQVRIGQGEDRFMRVTRGISTFQFLLVCAGMFAFLAGPASAQQPAPAPPPDSQSSQPSQQPGSSSSAPSSAPASSSSSPSSNSPSSSSS